jgi:hypothetical protein
MNRHACPELVHRALKSSFWAFALGTTRLLEHQAHECYQDLGNGPRWIRDCRACGSTLAMPIGDGVVVASVREAA